MDVEHELRILDDVHPEPERKAADHTGGGGGGYPPQSKPFRETIHRRFSSPVAFPCVPDIRVADGPFISLLVQKVEHILNGQRERRATMGGAEHSLKKVIHKLLQRTLVVRRPTHNLNVKTFYIKRQIKSNWIFIVLLRVFREASVSWI